MTSQHPRFWWVFFYTGSSEKDTENGTAVMLSRSFLFCDNFRNLKKSLSVLKRQAISKQDGRFFSNGKPPYRRIIFKL